MKFYEFDINVEQVAYRSNVVGQSVRNYLLGNYPWTPLAAKVMEELTSVNRLHLLYPDEFDRHGNRLPLSEKPATSEFPPWAPKKRIRKRRYQSATIEKD